MTGAQEVDFQTKLSAMIAKELTGDPEQIGALIERLTDALGLAIAVASRGDGHAADTLFEGATAYLTEAIAHHEKLARFMATFSRTRKESDHD